MSINLSIRNEKGQFLSHRTLLGSFGSSVVAAVGVVVAEKLVAYAIEKTAEIYNAKYNDYLHKTFSLDDDELNGPAQEDSKIMNDPTT